MTGAVDTSREACEAMCDWRSPFTSVQHRKEAFALIRALRAALDAAEQTISERVLDMEALSEACVDIGKQRDAAEANHKLAMERWGETQTRLRDAEQERDEARTDCDGLGHHVAILLQQYLDAMNARDAADATGYARGVRDAADELPCTAEDPRENDYQTGRYYGVMEYQRRILALLPATEKEKNDAE